MAFDKSKHMIRVQGGREYLPVSARLIWFREEHPDWGIATNPIEINLEKQYAIYQASIFNAEGKLMATATKMENVRGFPDYIEKAETGAVGRALAFCAYGTQFDPDLDEKHRPADTPPRFSNNRLGGSEDAPPLQPTGGHSERPAQGKAGDAEWKKALGAFLAEAEAVQDYDVRDGDNKLDMTKIRRLVHKILGNPDDAATPTTAELQAALERMRGENAE
jgi:hypothetical protein